MRLGELPRLGEGDALGLEAAQFGEALAEGALVGCLGAVEMAEAGFDGGVEEGVGRGGENLFLPLGEAAEVPRGVEQVAEDLLLESGLGADGAVELVAKFGKFGAVLFLNLEGGAGESGAKLDVGDLDGWLHKVTPALRLAGRVKRRRRKSGSSCCKQGAY